jgi:hypothetical protein
MLRLQRRSVIKQRTETNSIYLLLQTDHLSLENSDGWQMFTRNPGHDTNENNCPTVFLFHGFCLIDGNILGAFEQILRRTYVD